jgi:monoamine oxidase
MENEIIIIGGGAAGLMAARTLGLAGKRVTVLEARDRIGGRIYTLIDEFASKHTELGAEFVHGDLTVTLKVLKEAGIKYHSANAEMWRYENGHFQENSMIVEEWGLLIQRLNELEIDTDIWTFLNKEFPGERYESMRDSVWKFVSGYDTADPHNASAFALRSEWQNEQEDAQHRISGGYRTVVEYLTDDCKRNNGTIILNAVVTDVHWQAGAVKVVTQDGNAYHAQQLLVAMPLGVLQAPGGQKGAITFHPPIPEHTLAIQKMGFGAVIKLLVEFDSAFWLDDKTLETAGENIDKMGYLFSDEEIPTWWTQTPEQSKVLTGWLGGPAAADKVNTPDSQILEQGLQSLANIFKRNYEDLKRKLVNYRVMNWTADPFTRGSYAYDTVEAPGARKVLTTPINDTIYFTGEYLYEGTAMGTVEAALTNGEEVANKIVSMI